MTSGGNVSGCGDGGMCMIGIYYIKKKYPTRHWNEFRHVTKMISKTDFPYKSSSAVMDIYGQTKYK